MSQDIIQSHSAEQTQKAGFDFASKLKPHDVVFLIGDLGAGKTTFVQGLASGLGISTRIISPTFVLMRQYNVAGRPIKTLYHLDLYRLKDEKEVVDIDMHDYLNDKEGIVIIEWPEIGQNLLNRAVWEIKIKMTSENSRMIEFNHGNK